MKVQQILVSILLLLMIAATSPSKASENDVLGRWYTTDGSGRSFVFLADGTLKLYKANGTSESAEYWLLKGGILQIDLGDVDASAKPPVMKYEVKDGQLTLAADETKFVLSKQAPAPVEWVREQVGEGITLSAFAKAAISEYYQEKGMWAATNRVAQVSEADDIQGVFVSSVAIDQGVIIVTYGNNADYTIRGKTIVLKPSVEGGYVSWRCSSSTIDREYLPRSCL